MDVKLRKPLLLKMIERCEDLENFADAKERDFKMLPQYTTLATEF